MLVGPNTCSTDAVIYPELHAHSCFSFLDGASQPEELAERAAALGYEAVALTDHDGLCGSLAFAHAAREAGLRAITGAEITLDDGAHLTLLVEDATGYRNLCRLITAAHAGDRRAPAATLDHGRPARRRPALPVGLRPPRRPRPAGGRGPAARGRGAGPAAAGDLRPRPLRRRAAAPVRARRRPPQPAAGRAGRPAAGADGRDRRPPRPLPPPRVPAGRARGDQVQHHPRGQRGRAARKPRGGAARARRDGRPLPARRRPRRRRGGRPLPLRPHPRPGLQLPRLRRERRARRRGARAHLPRTSSSAATPARPACTRPVPASPRSCG